MTEQETVDDLVERWVALARDFVSGAADVTEIYVYALSEQGESYANVFVEQGGVVRTPDGSTASTRARPGWGGSNSCCSPTCGPR